MVTATAEANSRVPLSSPAQASRETYLIIVARDRPDLFEYLTENYGHEMKVILDRRQRPRLPIPRPHHPPSSIWYAEMQREGFMMVPTAATTIENAG